MKKLNCYKTAKWILSALPFFLHIWTPTCLCAIQRFHRAACAGTVQIRRGLGFPNKRFATRNSRCIYVCTACYNGVGSEKLTASERYRCPSLYFFRQLASASDMGSSWTCLFFRCRNVTVRSSKDISCICISQTVASRAAVPENFLSSKKSCFRLSNRTAFFWIFFIFVPLTSKFFEKITGTSPKSLYKTKKTTNRSFQRFVVLLVRSRELESLALWLKERLQVSFYVYLYTVLYR